MQVIMVMEIYTVYMLNDILHVDWLYEDLYCIKEVRDTK